MEGTRVENDKQYFQFKSRVFFELLFPLSLQFIYLFYCVFLFGAGTKVERTLANQQTPKSVSPSYARNTACAGANAGTLAENVNKQGAEPLIFI